VAGPSVTGPAETETESRHGEMFDSTVVKEVVSTLSFGS
jgi:hypothetical protein